MKITISLKEEIQKETKLFCEKTGRTFSGLISYLLTKFFEEQSNGKERS